MIEPRVRCGARERQAGRTREDEASRSSAVDMLGIRAEGANTLDSRCRCGTLRNRLSAIMLLTGERGRERRSELGCGASFGAQYVGGF
jgi:hypothetical protein